jgi:hypothetical protein
LNPEINPFPTDDPHHRALWDMLVRRDIDAFLAAVWSTWARPASVRCGSTIPGSMPVRL